MDFTSPKKIGLEIENDFQQLIYGKGYDHNFVTVEPDKAVKYEDLPFIMENFTKLLKLPVISQELNFP